MNLFVLLGKNSLKHGNFHNTLRDNRVKENGSEVARSCLNFSAKSLVVKKSRSGDKKSS